MMKNGNIQFLSFKNRGLTLRASVHCARRRGGTWVVVSHGFTGHRLGPDYLYVKIARHLQALGISTLRFDFSGMGESDGRFPDMNVSSMRSDLLCAARLVRRTHAPGRLLFLGHSLGGAVAALAAAMAKADGLVLLAPVARPAGMLDRRKDTVLAAGRNRRGFYENGPHEMSLSFVDDLKRCDPLSALSGFAGRMIVFQGEADKSITIDESRLYIEKATSGGLDASYHVLAGNDHNFTTVAGVEYLCTTIGAWAREFAR